MIAVNVDQLFVSWLASKLPTVGVASERPGDLETRLPFVVIRRGSSGGQRGLDNPRIDCDFYGATRTAASDLARAVQTLFEEQTPTAWLGAQFTWLRTIQAPIKVPDANQSLHHVASINSFSLQ